MWVVRLARTLTQLGRLASIVKNICRKRENRSTIQPGSMAFWVALGGGGNLVSAAGDFRAGGGLPNWVDQPRTKEALYSARKVAARSAPEVAFPSPSALPLPRPTEDRGSTIEARSGHPRTPRDGHGPVGSGGGPYSACGVHRCRYSSLARHCLS